MNREQWGNCVAYNVICSGYGTGSVRGDISNVNRNHRPQSRCERCLQGLLHRHPLYRMKEERYEFPRHNLDSIHAKPNKQVGDYNVFQPKCEVGKEVTVASGCNIGKETAAAPLTNMFLVHSQFSDWPALSCAVYHKTLACRLCAEEDGRTFPSLHEYLYTSNSQSSRYNRLLQHATQGFVRTSFKLRLRRSFVSPLRLEGVSRLP